jgi:hypothetical protein
VTEELDMTSTILGYAGAILALVAACAGWVVLQRWTMRHTGRDTAGDCDTCDLRRPGKDGCG